MVGIDVPNDIEIFAKQYSLMSPLIIESIPRGDPLGRGAYEYVKKNLETKERPMMAELSKKNETELVSRIYMERLPSGISVVWASGLLVHEGVLSQTPELIGLPLSEEKSEKLWEIFNKNNYTELKSNVEEILYERLAKQEATILGEERGSQDLKEVDQYMKLGPDQNIHFFVHGWTGNHMEFMQHMAQMIEGQNINFKDPEFKNHWISAMFTSLNEAIDIKGYTNIREKMESVIKFAAKKWGAFNPENHVYVGLGIQGAMGTTPREIGERLGIPASNESVVPNDLVVQVGAAIKEFANKLASKNTDGSKKYQDIFANILTKVSHLWGHSMGGWVVLKELDEDSDLSQLLKQVGNDRLKVHAWNPVFLGSKLTEAEYERLKMYVPEELLQMAIKSVNMHEAGLVNILVNGAPKILKPKIMQILNRAFGVSEMTQNHLLGSMKGAASHAAHADVTENSLHDQYVMNQATLGDLPMVIGGDAHRDNLRARIGDGSLEIWNGSDDDRILNKMSILVLQMILGVKTNIQTIDHLINPERMKELAPLVVMPTRGKVLGGEANIANFMRFMMETESFFELIQPLKDLLKKAKR